MNLKGGINWFTILMIPTLIVLLIAVLPVIDILTGTFFETLSQSQNSLFPNLSMLLIGIIPLVLVLGIIWVSIKTLEEPRAQPPTF